MLVENKYESKQDYGTPWEFIHWVERTFAAKLSWDLAASEENHKAPAYFPESANSLKQDWSTLFGNLWLNPPYADIAPWAAKCAERMDDKRHIFLLIPASVGTCYFAKHINKKSCVFPVSPRIVFEGAPINPKTGKPDPFKKDLMLCVYGFGMHGFDCLRWGA